jgi:hypothetical protein
MLENLTQEIFEQNLNTKFRVQPEPDAVFELELTEVSNPDAEKAVKPTRQERFSLLFRGSKEKLLRDGIYKFEHERMGEFEIYIQPVGQDEESFYYESVFNRLT